MKKSALILLTLCLPLSFLIFAPSVHASTADCSNWQAYGFKDQTSCDAASAACLVSTMPDKGACVQFMGSISKLFSDQTVGPWYNQTPSQFATKVTDTTNESDIFGERYTYAQINWIINSLATMINPTAGIDSPEKLLLFMDSFMKAIDALQANKLPSFQDYAKLGPAGLFAGGITALYSNPPASGIGEVKTLASRVFDLGTGTKPALAQGYGYAGLSTGGAVLMLWTATRNMAYLIIILLLIASGFLIMFRVKINPQTVVSLQTMIPKLIITMLLITFSFAIAGLVIDLIYVIITAFVGFMSANGVMDAPKEITKVIGQLTSSSFWVYFLLQMSTWIFSLILSVTLFAIIAFIVPPPAGLIIGTLVGIGVFIWMSWTMVKIFIMLVKACVNLILQIIIGPLQIMLDLIPGQSGFGPWFRNLIASASVFVVVPIMLFIQYTLSWSYIANNWLHIKSFGGMGGVNLKLPYVELAGNAMGSWNQLTPILIGMFIFSLTPKIADMIRDMLKIPPFKYGTAFGETMKPVTSLMKAGTGVGILAGSQEVGAAVKTRLGGSPLGSGLEQGIYKAGEIAQKTIGT